jgi:hypothetical protein
MIKVCRILAILMTSLLMLSSPSFAGQRTFLNSGFDNLDYTSVTSKCQYSTGHAWYCPDGTAENVMWLSASSAYLETCIFSVRKNGWYCPSVNLGGTEETWTLSSSPQVLKGSSAIEIWTSDFNIHPRLGTTSDHHFAEIMAYGPDFLYQNIDVTRGEVIYWTFDHAARKGGICNVFDQASTPVAETILPEEVELIIKGPLINSREQILARASDSVAGQWGTHQGTAKVKLATGTYRVGLRSVIPSAGSCGNFIDNVQIGFCPTGQIRVGGWSGSCQPCADGLVPSDSGDRCETPTPITSNPTTTRRRSW